jgi:Na+-driven multidrug efflux pump
MVGQNLGADQPERAKMAVWSIARLVLFVTVGILVLLGVFAPSILTFFSQDPETIRIGVMIIRLLAIGYIGQTVSWVFDSALVGAGDTISPMIIYAIMWSIQLPLAYVLSIWFDFGTLGIWIALDLGWTLQAVLLWSKFKQGKWQFTKI